MVSYPNFLQVYFKDFEVLILIVVEDGLVHKARKALGAPELS